MLKYEHAFYGNMLKCKYFCRHVHCKEMWFVFHKRLFMLKSFLVFSRHVLEFFFFMGHGYTGLIIDK